MVKTRTKCKAKDCENLGRLHMRNGVEEYHTYCAPCNQLYHKYRIRNPDRLRMFKEANGTCPICKERMVLPTSERPRAEDVAVVDHCHDTGKIRGLICSGCNTGLGKFKHSIPTLMEAVSYIYERGQKHDV